MYDTMNWLLEGPPWVAYRARLDLLGQSLDAPQVVAARESMLADSQIQALVAELSTWPGPVLKSHKDAKHLLHKLSFAADLGLKSGDPGVDETVGRILEHQAPEGPFQILVNIPTHFGGTGQDQLAWMLCDAPLVLAALIRFSLAKDPRVQAGVAYLVGVLQENGWPCAATSELGRFRGPGRKTDPCPYANLVMLKMLTQIPELHGSEAIKVGAETLLTLWEQRRESRPYLFAMGTDFAKLKAPLIWYDLLHLLDVLTRVPGLHRDDRLLEMASILEAKADAAGRFGAESVWLAWKEWEFGQKRTPSRWITLLASRLLRRLDRWPLDR